MKTRQMVVSPEVHEVLKELRWENRLNSLDEVLRMLLAEYGEEEFVEEE